MKKYLLLIPLLLFTLAACSSGPKDAPDQQATIDATVQTTVAQVTTIPPGPSATTAVTSPFPSPSVPTVAPATPTPPPTQAAATRLIMPPAVKDFKPEPRPASTRGEPEAPVVMYEWADYT